jgi:hypothetical protein
MSMRSKMTPVVVSLLAVASAACASSRSLSAQTPPADAAQEKRFAAFKEKGAKAPLVVLPVLIHGKAMKEVGDALGLVLEQDGGFDDVSPAATSFTPPAGATAETMAALLGDFVKKSSPGEGHALLSEFVVKGNQFEAVRTWIVDHDGAAVWTDSQHAGDADFDRVRPHEPLECCVVVAQRLRGALGVTAPEKEHEGRMARLWAEKSGTPLASERKAMEERAAALKKAGKSAKIVVFPARVAGSLDPAQGAALAKLLAGACVATTTDAMPALEIKATSNEQRTLWDLARGFQAHLAKNPVDADYALIADYIMTPDRKQVGAVHFVLCTGKGEWVAADFQNSHHEDFNSVAPANAGDCDKLVLRRLEHYLR